MALLPFWIVYFFVVRTILAIREWLGSLLPAYWKKGIILGSEVIEQKHFHIIKGEKKLRAVPSEYIFNK